MGNSLVVFEGHELEVLTKSDVNVDFEGEVLFNGKQTAGILGYKNPSESIRTKVNEKYKYKVKNDNILESIKHGFRNLNNSGEIFVTEKGVMKLIINSNMPKAQEFEDKVWDIVMQVKNTGKFDSTEENLKLIQDETERDLSLGLYGMQQALQSNPNDYTLSLLVQNKKLELDQYKQHKRLEILDIKTQAIEEKTKQQDERINNLFVIGDRKVFNHEVKSTANAAGMKINQIYNLTYIKLNDIYGIDIEARSRNAKKKLQEERLNEGKKAYSPDTLNNKAGKLVIADECDLWNELGKSLMAVKDELLHNKQLN